MGCPYHGITLSVVHSLRMHVVRGLKVMFVVSRNRGTKSFGKDTKLHSGSSNNGNKFEYQLYW